MGMTVEEAAKKYRIEWGTYNPFEEIELADLETAFKSGAKWQASVSPWIEAEDVKEDGSYLTVVKNDDGKILIEIAPWKNGEYHGCYHINVYAGKAEVVMCANIYELVPMELII